MPRLLAEDLLLLCWDTNDGKAHRACADRLGPGIGGALVLDALRADALAVRDGRAVATDTPADDPLLREVAEAARGRRGSTVKALVQRLGTARHRQEILDRLVAQDVLRREQRRLLGIIPLTRHPAADPAVAPALKATVRDLLTGTRAPKQADTHHVLLAALAGPAGAVDVLVDRSQRKQAHRRAEAFTQGQGIPAAVNKVVADTQLAVVAAVAAAVVANQSTSNTNTSS